MTCFGQTILCSLRGSSCVLARHVYTLPDAAIHVLERERWRATCQRLPCLLVDALTKALA